MKTKLMVLGAVCGMAIIAATPASAAEFITNGGFETGDFSGFSVAGVGSSGVYGNFPGLPPELEGFRAAFIGAPVTLSQDIATVVGQTYRFGFTNQVDVGSTSNSFSALFGSNVVFSQSNSSGMNFTPRSFDVIATSNLTRVSFAFASQGGFQNFDNVTVTDVASAVPEPATWAMMLVGFGAVGYSMRRRKISYKALQAI